MRHLDKIEEYLIAAFLGAMVALNFGNVLSRYVLNASWSFTSEVSLILFIWTILLAAAVAYKRSEHLGFPLILDKLPPNWRVVFVGFSGLMSTLLLVFVAITGYDLMTEQFEFDQRTAVLQLPQWVSGAAIPVGAVFLVVRTAQATVREVALIRRGGGVR